MVKLLAKYMAEERGATAIEYGLIGALIAVAVGAVAYIIGDEIEATFTTILTELQA